MHFCPTFSYIYYLLCMQHQVIFFLFLQDVEKDYNPKDLATFLLGQNPELLQQNFGSQLAINRWASYLFILIDL